MKGVLQDVQQGWTDPSPFRRKLRVPSLAVRNARARFYSFQANIFPPDNRRLRHRELYCNRESYIRLICERCSGYRVTESDERARSVTERRQYHRAVAGRPHNAQTSTHWPSFIVHTLWSVSRFSTSRRLQKEAPNSGYRVTESDERARSVTERRQYHRVVPGRPHKVTMLKHPRIGRHSSCMRSGACLASTSRRLQKEAPNSVDIASRSRMSVPAR